MKWVKICFKSSETKVEGSVSEIEDGKLNRHCHEEGDEEGESDDIIYNNFHACPFDPQVLDNKQVSDQGNGDRKTEVVKSNENAGNVNTVKAISPTFYKQLLSCNLAYEAYFRRTVFGATANAPKYMQQLAKLCNSYNLYYEVKFP